MLNTDTSIYQIFDKPTTELTPNDVYALPAQEIERNPSILVGYYYNHLEGSGIHEWVFQWTDQQSDRLEIRIHKYFDFDGRRFWRLASVWLDNQPVMIIQNAGREGDDHRRRFITSEDRFREMCKHIREFLKIEEEPLEDVVDPNDVIGRPLIAFYGNSLDGYFQRYNY